MLLYFDEIVRGDYTDEVNTEKILINSESVCCVKPAKYDGSKSVIFLSNGRIVEVDGELELIREFLTQEQGRNISDSNDHISGSNERRATDRPNGKNGS